MTLHELLVALAAMFSQWTEGDDILSDEEIFNRLTDMCIQYMSAEIVRRLTDE